MTKDIKQIQKENREIISEAITGIKLVYGNCFYSEITLDRVLLALGDGWELKVVKDNSPDQHVYFWIFNHEVRLLWEAKEQTLEEQDEKTQISVWKLLGGDDAERI